MVSVHHEVDAGKTTGIEAIVKCMRACVQCYSRWMMQWFKTGFHGFYICSKIVRVCIRLFIIVGTAASTARQPNRHVHFQDNISTGSLNSQADLAASESDRLQDNTASGQANISEEAKSEQLFSVSYSNDAAGEEDLTEDC